MSVVHVADGVPPSSRDEYWRWALSEVVGRLEPLGLPDRVAAGEMGVLKVGDLAATGAGGARRTTAHLSSSDPELCKIDVVVSGRAVVEQGGREAALGPGDFTLIDLSRPATWSMPGSMRIIAVVFPRALLPLHGNDVSQLTGAPIAGEHGAAALVSSLARQLPAQLDDCGPADGARLGTALIDMLGAVLAARLDRDDTLPASSRRRALLLRIHAFIEQHLGDPTLSPTEIAAAHYISVRYLHKLFEGEQATVADWIRRRRLERCRRDLLDPRLRFEPAYAIGARWGLPNAAHFSHLFRASFGLPPGEYRRAGSPGGDVSAGCPTVRAIASAGP